MVTTKSRATLHHIAKEVGVSASTVSRALNNRERIDPETRARVQAAAERLGYRQAGGAEAPARTMAIAVICDRMQGGTRTSLPANLYGTFDHIQSMLFSVEQAASAHNYHMVLNSIQASEGELPSSVRSRFVDGVILMGGSFPDRLVEQIAAEVPTVFLASYTAERPVDSVRINYRLGAEQAVGHLGGLGHRRIALLNGPNSTNTSAEKLSGFLSGCHRHGIALGAELVVAAPGFFLEDGAQVAEGLLNHGGFTAVIAGTDILAYSFILAAERRGLQIPGDISVVSLYNSDERDVREGPVPLTGIHVPYDQLGHLAVERLLSIITQPQPPVETLLRAEFVVKGSTAPPKG